MKQASPDEMATGALAAATYDWQATQLGPRASWPHALKLSVDILLNTPLPMLLAWGEGPAVVFNEAYARLAGDDAPGGIAGAPMAPPLAANADAVRRAGAGETIRLARQPVTFTSADGDRQLACDIHLTPVRDGQDKVAGVLCALGDCGAHAAQASAAPQRGLRVLVVEDNLDSQYLVCEMLKAFGHHADGVGDAEAALGMLGAATYDVLFSDVSLPGMSGVELARQGLVLQPAMQVIFASGYGDTLLRHLPFPFVSLQKPYEMEQLQGTLDTMARQLGR